MRFIVRLLGVSALLFGFVGVEQSGGAVVTLQPVADRSADDANHDGTWDTWMPLSDALLAYNGRPSGYDIRTALEFDLSSLPARTIVNSAVLRIRYNGANGWPANTLQFNGYVGDGILTFDDYRSGQQIGPLYPAFGPGGDLFYRVPATEFVQFLIDDGRPFAGFMVRNISWNQTAFFSSRATNASLRPVLVLDYSIAPTIPLGGDARVDEGSEYTLTLGAVVDPGTDPIVAYTINWGDGTSESFTGSPDGVSKTHTYADGPNDYVITVDLTDKHRTFEAAGSKAVTVDNVAPTVNAGPDGAVLKDGAFTSFGYFTDPGVDTWTATVDYGDGSGVQTLALEGKTFSLSHTYADFGTYPVTVSVADKDGGVGSDTTTVAVNYASGGFLPPLSQNIYFALGRTIPVKFQLTDASGSVVTSMSAVHSISVTGPAGTFAPPPAAGSTGWRNNGTQYVYNWQTSKTDAQETYRIVVTLADGSTIAQDIQLVSSAGAAK